MLASVLGLLLAATPHLAVVVVSDAGEPKAADAAVAALSAALDAQPVRLGAYLKAQGPACRADLRCLAAAPELSEVPRFLALDLRQLPNGLLAAELQLVDRVTGVGLGRSASAVDKAGLAGWAQAAGTRLVKASAPRAAPRSAFPAAPFRAPAPPAARIEPAPMAAPARPAPPAPGRPPASDAPRRTQSGEPESEWSAPVAVPPPPRPAPAPPASPPPSSLPAGDDEK